MLYVVVERCKKILFKIDAWDEDCFEKAYAFINERGLKAIKEEITAAGNGIIWVEA